MRAVQSKGKQSRDASSWILVCGSGSRVMPRLHRCVVASCVHSYSFGLPRSLSWASLIPNFHRTKKWAPNSFISSSSLHFHVSKIQSLQQSTEGRDSRNRREDEICKRGKEWDLQMDVSPCGIYWKVDGTEV